MIASSLGPQARCARAPVPAARQPQLRWRSTASTRGNVRPGTLAPLRATATEFDAAKFVLNNGLVDYYEVLGVDDDATAEEVKKAYRWAPPPLARPPP